MCTLTTMEVIALIVFVEADAGGGGGGRLSTRGVPITFHPIFFFFFLHMTLSHTDLYPNGFNYLQQFFYSNQGIPK